MVGFPLDDGVKHVLRGTHGRHAGSVFVIEGPLILGRAPHADVQIVQEGVSRQHARIRVDEQGQVVIADLQSGSGTKVGGRRIDKKILRPGETVQIGDARFVYERRTGDLMTSPSFVERTSSAAALHRTNPGVSPTRSASTAAKGSAGIYKPGSGGAVPATRPAGPPAPRRPPPRRAAPPPEPPAPEPAHHPIGHGLSSGAPRAPIGWDDAPTFDQGPGLPTVDLDQGVAELAYMFSEVMGNAESPGRFSLRSDAETETKPATGPDLTGPEFRGLMERILHYHALAAQLTRNEAIDDAGRQALAQYESDFRQDPEQSKERRQWRRFPVRSTANAVWFRDLRSRSVAIRLLDVSASGVCFESGERVFDSGDVLSLLVALPQGGRQAVFSARVSWVSRDRDRCGAIFVGPGAWQPQ